MKLNEILNQKKSTYMVLGIIIILASILTINALISGTKHSQTNVLVSVDGYTMTLQEAINGNYLIEDGTSATSSATTSLIFGHSPSEIWVSVNGAESTLAAAITADNLCGSTSVPYTGSINPGHLASEIEVTIGGSTKTLQQAIDSGNFCCVPLTCAQTGCGTHSNGCGGTLNCGACEYCGDGTCNAGETCSSCPGDCGACDQIYYSETCPLGTTIKNDAGAVNAFCIGKGWSSGACDRVDSSGNTVGGKVCAYSGGWYLESVPWPYYCCTWLHCYR